MHTVAILLKRTDEALWSLVVRGEQLAFQAIYQKYAKKLYAIAYSRIQSREVTEEIVQNVFIALWEKRAHLTIKNLSSYLAAAVKHDVFDYYRATRVRQQHAYQVKLQGEPTENTTERIFSFDELHAAMQEEVDKLPERCRLIFKMSREEACSVKEIASRLNISPKTVDNQVNKAVTTLRLQLADFLCLLVACLIAA